MGLPKHEKDKCIFKNENPYSLPTRQNETVMHSIVATFRKCKKWSRVNFHVFSAANRVSVQCGLYCLQV